MQPVLAIDLGTSTVRTALGGSNGVRVFPNRHAERGLPLWLARSAADGNAALPCFQGLKQRLGAPETTGQLVAVLRELREDGEAQAGEGIRRCVFCLPSIFPDKARAALGSAAQSAGFQSFRLLSDVQAQWLVLPDPPRAGPILVYSLGAGIFSAEILTDDHGTPRVAASLGSMQGAGLAIDQALLALILRQAQVAVSDSSQLPLLARVRGMVEQAKIILSRQEQVRLDFPLQEWVGAGQNLEILLTRAELEQVIRPLLKEAHELIGAELIRLNMEPNDFTQVLVSGGSTLIPLVEQELAASFCPALRRIPADAAVQGAAQWGAGLEDSAWAPIEPKPPAPVLEVVAPLLPAKPLGKGQWAAMFKPPLDQAEDLWQEGRFPESIAAFMGMFGQAREYLATLHQQYGTKLIETQQFAEAIRILRIGYRCCFDANDHKNPTDPHGLRQIYLLLERAFELHGRQLWADKRFEAASGVAREGVACCPQSPRLAELATEMRVKLKNSGMQAPRKPSRR